MVKNTTGGKHKNEARKFAGGGGHSKLRLSEDELECYAVITKMFGNGMCQVSTNYKDKSLELLCHMRGKFRGRNKKNNFLTVNSIILVGIRDWESKVDKCDLLEVYDLDQIRTLSSMPSVTLPKVNTMHGSSDNPDATDERSNGFVFSNEDNTTIYENPMGDYVNNKTNEVVSFEDI